MTPETTIALPDGRTATVRFRSPDSYIPNPRNTNKGRERGKAALDTSLQESGFHRGIVVANDGTVVNGNHAYQAASELEVVKGWIEIEVEGDVGIVTKRVDWQDAQAPQAILAAIADNRTSELNFELDTSAFADALTLLGGLDLEIPAELYTDIEIEERLEQAIREQEEDDMEEREDKLDSERYPLAIVLSWSDHRRWEEFKETMGTQSDTKAFLKLFNTSVESVEE